MGYCDDADSSRLPVAVVSERHNGRVEASLPNTQPNPPLTDPPTISPRGLSDPRQTQDPIIEVSIGQKQGETELGVVLLRPQIQKIIDRDRGSPEAVAGVRLLEDVKFLDRWSDKVLVSVHIEVCPRIDVLDEVEGVDDFCKRVGIIPASYVVEEEVVHGDSHVAEVPSS